jgi:serine phosphatase RsbU (regulator of sigma subunit)
MGSVRAVLRAYAVEDPDPTSLLVRLNRFLLVELDGDTYVTAVVARYEPDSRRLHLARAGHAAPMLVEPDRVISLAPRGPALGVLPHAEFEEQVVTLAPGAALCAYTDGLVDRHTDPASVTERRLAEIAAGALAAFGDAQCLVDRIIDEMLAGAAPDDDICLAVLRAPDS